MNAVPHIGVCQEAHARETSTPVRAPVSLTTPPARADLTLDGSLSRRSAIRHVPLICLRLACVDPSDSRVTRASPADRVSPVNLTVCVFLSFQGVGLSLIASCSSVTGDAPRKCAAGGENLHKQMRNFWREPVRNLKQNARPESRCEQSVVFAPIKPRGAATAGAGDEFRKRRELK